MATPSRILLLFAAGSLLPLGHTTYLLVFLQRCVQSRPEGLRGAGDNRGQGLPVLRVLGAISCFLQQLPRCLRVPDGERHWHHCLGWHHPGLHAAGTGCLTHSLLLHLSLPAPLCKLTRLWQSLKVHMLQILGALATFVTAPSESHPPSFSQFTSLPLQLITMPISFTNTPKSTLGHLLSIPSRISSPPPGQTFSELPCTQLPAAKAAFKCNSDNRGFPPLLDILLWLWSTGG